MPKRTSLEQELLDKADQYLPGGYLGNLTVRDDLNFLVREGRGSHIIDVSGNEYVDWLMGSGPMVLGHAHPAVVEAVIKAVEQGSTFFATNEKAVMLAEELVSAVPCAEQVRFTTSGTDACFQAMRAARAYRKQEKVLKFEGGFHGTSDYALMSVTPSAAVEYPEPEPNSGGIPRAIQDLMLIAPFNDLETTSAIIDAHHGELAAVIVEPLQRIITPQPGFLEGLRQITARYEIPLIFDEIVTGFRLAYGGAQEHYGVVPDLCTVGKIMGGGYPLAAVLGRADILSVFDPAEADSETWINQIGTLNGNPIACAAGLATLAELRKPGTYEGLRATGKQVREALVDICSQHGVPVQMCGEDAIFDVYFTDRPVANYRDGLAGDSQMMARLNAGLLERGVLKGTQKFYPSVVHTEADVQKTIDAFKEVIPTLRG
ncbi:MAG: aminotransferase class III-fold pyridoxal phosphate-dependent enzyme [Chloroflexi bacterium]|nr:aminotransferase class III-fold pyridoxal phosphate-dependent enzyme [Chloroflexota bacterium]MCI0786336.1 aminotransferase class III-fold pyridoxal phosphate-dependent enzyme [Chloroflexota bacterium]MCI0794188.1 aminotransferase class III-fold pyridoxal phosphate-dependent enzyme [Chloroflexota bacterium]MCI0825862.1 aminotransferase class III-fold pyridoxal phosphate-dependent enzyme [Chloroflexota bacterium]MCI0865543.1 aminotransferase class III-fold pyridoxal phosphate-dependent enzyme